MKIEATAVITAALAAFTILPHVALALTGDESVKIHFDLEFDDFPGFRFTTWAALPSPMRSLATTAGYTAETWDQVGTADFEYGSWDEFGDGERQALGELGFSEDTWDCYMNHYDSYSWIEIVMEDLDEAAKVLGYTPDNWEDGTASTGGLDWDELSDGQKWAAAAFCYFEDTWNEVGSIDQMNQIPTLYPHFRFIVWDDLPSSMREAAGTAGWTEDSWNTPDKSEIEYTAFADLDEGQRTALMSMGFYEDQYDCYVNHYYGYSWEDLEQYGLAQYFEAFGWTSDLYTNGGDIPSAWSSDSWSQLSEVQKTAADQLCWFEEIWNEEDISTWDEPLEFPQVRFTPWDDLTSTQQRAAVTAGWADRAQWNIPGTADHEDTVFDDLSPEQQMALRSLGFYDVDMYDCYVNHYEGLDWEELSDWGVLDYVVTLGWTKDSWDDNKSPPASEDLAWDELNEKQKEAANSLCYFAELWDKSSLSEWEGVAWPEDRYWTWDGLDKDEQTLLVSIGWNKQTWDTPGTADFEFKSWNTLTWQQREALTEYGFYKNQWNCYMTHYDDYDWFELVMENVASHFETLGWTSDTWNTDQEPWAWKADWDDLSDAEQDAAWEICYFKEIWDEVPMEKWNDNLRSGGPSYRQAGGGSGGGGRPGMIISLILLALIAAGGSFFLWKKQQGAKDPTYPKTNGPGIHDLSFETEKGSDGSSPSPDDDDDDAGSPQII